MVTGPSGSGKSTVLHLVGGMDRPDEGTIEVDGSELTARQLDAHRRRIGFVFQRVHHCPRSPCWTTSSRLCCPAAWTSTAGPAPWNSWTPSALPPAPTPCRPNSPAGSTGPPAPSTTAPPRTASPRGPAPPSRAT
ncbi:ATP-binding cassette domain-containing protein [Streptomyces sp. NPDC093591]|uniref:ATP-binding cassette domain-containing protein n=1 Tax=Streptomyces sp. NPDC093591 TaxID=3366044 RepID=UPI0038073804